MRTVGAGGGEELPPPHAASSNAAVQPTQGWVNLKRCISPPQVVPRGVLRLKVSIGLFGETLGQRPGRQSAE